MRFLYSRLIWGLSLTFMVLGTSAQQKVSFESKDGLSITADLYISSTQNPYIILLHQAGYSRGEYKEIAPKLVKLGYNCLALDQRSGEEVNFIKNETAAKAKEKNLPTNYIDALPDIHAAIDYVKQKSSKPIVLWGSSYSASLSLIVATEELKIGALVVFSPGEYFEPKNFIQSKISKISVPVLALSSKDEYPAMVDMLSVIPKSLVTTFKPTTDSGKHGSKALWESNPSSKEYWMAVTVFFSKLKK
ncbi:MAG: dienelactone hydrolase family protein [Bacteroidales bacterium]|nr:dienelactone hydrolase family protein [Bacteroidales bacterium]